jgi:LmbE family N-acetylglucosaminyl deacetylase
MTEAFGPVSQGEVSRMREEHGRMAGQILGCETRFLDFHDTRVEATPDAARRVAALIAEVKPDGVLTWGDAWARGMRHPDHQATGKIFRDAITLARLAKVVAPATPHRDPAPVFTFRGAYSQLPPVVVDVAPYVDTVHALARFYYERIGFGNAEWVDCRLRAAAEPHGLRYAEAFDAWETRGGVVDALLPASADPAVEPPHPPREEDRR